MASGNQGGRGAGHGPRLAVMRPGSVNRGFASMDPERQCEAADQGRKAARQGGNAPEAAQQASEAARSRERGSGADARPARGRGGRKPKPAGDTGEDTSG